MGDEMKRNALPALVLVFAALVATAAPAADAAPAEPPSRISAPSGESTARSAVLAYLALWSADALPDAAAPFSEHLVLTYSHAVPEIEAEVRGRTSVVNQVRAVAHLGREWTFGEVRLFPTPIPSVYFAQYSAAGSSPIDGASIRQEVLLSIELDRSQVVHIVEFSNPAIALATRPPATRALR